MIEIYLQASASLTNLHPNMFMQNLLGNAAIKGGRYSLLHFQSSWYTALEDVADPQPEF